MTLRQAGIPRQGRENGTNGPDDAIADPDTARWPVAGRSASGRAAGRYRERKAAPPLDAAALERLALRYVERFATTRARLAAYLGRKLRERGAAEDALMDIDALVARMTALGYIDDRAFAEARAGSMSRRGLGKRRIRAAFHADGIEAEDAEAIAPDIEARAVAAIVALARRRRIGPFAAAAPDRPLRERHFAMLMRGGHPPALAAALLALPPGMAEDDVANALEDVA